MKFPHSKVLQIGIFALLIIIVLLAINQFFILQKAHSTFENYAAFRGCVSVIKKTGQYGLCKLSSGQIIKIVLFKNKWYLDGDLPLCVSSMCL